MARCQAALDIVQRGQDVTGFGQYRMRARLDRGWPPSMFAAMPDGSYWTGAWGMTSRMEGVGLLFNAAASVSGTLEEVREIEWPVCAVHGSDPAVGHLCGEERVGLVDGMVVWWCPRAGHVVAPVGQFTAEVGRTRDRSPGAAAGRRAEGIRRCSPAVWAARWSREGRRICRRSPASCWFVREFSTALVGELRPCPRSGGVDVRQP